MSRLLDLRHQVADFGPQTRKLSTRRAILYQTLRQESGYLLTHSSGGHDNSFHLFLSERGSVNFFLISDMVVAIKRQFRLEV
jgi:hypothetical protein